MTKIISQDQQKIIEQYDIDQRFGYLLKEVINNDEIWILTDQHGSVMLNSDDEDCLPIWPNKEFAQAWATGEWQTCLAESISLKKWFSHWLPGLEDDELAIVVFPNQSEEGLILFPDEFKHELNKKMTKLKNS